MSNYTGAIPDTTTPVDWRTRAACRTEDPEVFFAEGRGSRGSVQQAQAVCHGCPVRIACGEYAIANGEYWGVWGGMSQNQLRTLRRRYGNSWDPKKGNPPTTKAAA